MSQKTQRFQNNLHEESMTTINIWLVVGYVKHQTALSSHLKNNVNIWDIAKRNE